MLEVTLVPWYAEVLTKFRQQWRVPLNKRKGGRKARPTQKEHGVSTVSMGSRHGTYLGDHPEEVSKVIDEAHPSRNSLRTRWTRCNCKEDLVSWTILGDTLNIRERGS